MLKLILKQTGEILKKGFYKPTKQNIIIIDEFEDYCEILLDGEYKTVLKNEIQILSSGINISAFSELKENIFISCIRNLLSDILYSYNTNRLTPEAHQYKPLVKFLNSENNRVLIADEVGLGKTIEAGMIYKEIDKREELKISLIVVPSSLTYKWKEEFNIRFDEYFTIYKTNQFLNLIDEYERFNTSKLFNEKIIISYHTLRDERVIEKLKNSLFEVDFLIMDEAHTMRNAGTSTYESAELITSISEHILFLTATPIQNSLYDLFNILTLLDNDYFRDYDYFEKSIKPNGLIHKLIAYIKNDYSLSDIKTLIQESSKNFPDYLNNILKEILAIQNLSNEDKIYFIDKLTKADHLSFIINRTKKNDIGLIIPRNAISKVVNITKEEKEYYDSVIEFVKFLNPHIPQGFITIMPERIASSSMIASLETFKNLRKTGKLFIQDIGELEEYYDNLIDIKDEAFSYLDEIIEKGECIGDVDSKFLEFKKILDDIREQNIKQVIVFSTFKKTLKYLENKLNNLGYKVSKIDGDNKPEDRFNTIKSFKNGDFDILLSSEVGSEGLDMQFCNVIINYDLPWNPMRVEQRIGRIDRIGQKFDKLHIFNLCIVDSIEDRIYNRLYTKLNIFEESIGELEPILGELEKEFSIKDLIELSQDELDKKIKLKELAAEKQKQEIKKYSNELDKMLNDAFSLKYQPKEYKSSNKFDFMQKMTKSIFIDFLKSNNISFKELKDGNVKLSSKKDKNILFNGLKQKMSDKRSLKYQEEKRVLQKLKKLSDVIVDFNDNSEDFNTLKITIGSPILNMIEKDKLLKPLYTFVTHKNHHDKYLVIYKVELKSLKNKTEILTILIDKNFNYINEIDFFEVINDCKQTDIQKVVDFEEIKKISIKYVIKNLQKIKQKEQSELERIINIKIDSIKQYYEKRVAKLKNIQKQLSQKDVLRMRQSELESLISQRDKKISELQEQKNVKESFEILGIVGMV